MRLRRPSLFLPALLAAAALALWFPGGRDEQRPGAPPPSDADYFLQQVKLVETDASGQPLRWLQAEHLAHYPDGTTELRRPRLALRSQTGSGPQHWRLQAERGRIRQSNQVALEGAVRLERRGDGKQPPLTLLTERLQLDLQAQTARTDAPLTLITDQGRLQARGLRASLAEQRLQLLAEVRGQYAP